LQQYNDQPGNSSPSSNNLAETDHENDHQTRAENNLPDLSLVSLDVEFREALNPNHRQMLLEGSAISLEVVRERGYRTVQTKAELKGLGFAGSQRNPPGLLIPVYSPHGEIVSYQLRPDQPRIKDGRPIKYETPRRSRMTLDVHPFARGKLVDPSVPLFVTEGVKKGDALVSRGLCAVSLLGVWNWRGTNEHGGLTALPEWELIALNGRQVYIVFDSDIVLKPEVYRAMVRLKNFLEGR
jgi:hypothetical protein